MLWNFRKNAKVESFWQWLAANTDRIRGTANSAIGEISNEIGEHFSKSFPGLVWEISRVPSAPWIFCVSADGDAKLFSRVEAIVLAAPEINGWKIQAFRQRGSVSTKLKMGDRTLSYDDIWCSIEPQGNGISVTLWIRGLNEQTEEALGGGALILLDNAIGEYDTVTRVKSLGRRALPSNPQRQMNFIPLAELPRYLDETRR